MGEPNFERYGITKQPLEIVLENLDRVRSERVYFQRVRPRLIKSDENSKKTSPIRQKRIERCKNLYRNAILSGINVDNIFEDTDAKTYALRNIMHYKGLRGVRSIEEATPARIGEVYKKDFYSGKRFTAK